MLDPRKNMIVIDGEIKTSSVERCWNTSNPHRCNIKFNNSSKTYSYSPNRVLLLENPVLFDPQHCRLLHKGKQLGPIAYIAAFQQGSRKFWYIEYTDGKSAGYKGSEIELIRSCLEDSSIQNIFEYLRDVAAINPLKANDGTRLLLAQYQKIEFIPDDSAAACYLNPGKFPLQHASAPPLFYPFGCNASQQKAIQAAFEHQLSIIQGPPGTGKTQTILNIVTNIIAQGQTVLIVSNNNSAIENIVEKLDKHDMGFIAALLGSSDNKSVFIETQAIEKAIPAQIDSWYSAEADSPEFLKTIQAQAASMQEIFARQERLALTRQELTALKTEQTHFEQEATSDPTVTLRRKLSSARLLTLWNELQTAVEKPETRGLFAKWLEAIRWFLLKRKVARLFNGIRPDPQRQDLYELIPAIQRDFYHIKHEELSNEIEQLQKGLAATDARQAMARLSDDSMRYLRNLLRHRFGRGHERPVFQRFTAGFVKEYPVILSTAFSSRSNLRANALFDYVIMDEASQVSSDTGALALMCARNAVIVGDSKQLPNVITNADRLRLQAIGAKHAIDACYDCAGVDFLESVCRVLPDAPQTLLREHYRCHPKIIDFCNRKFYGGQLVIMTEDRGEADVISAWRTVPGDHARSRFNQREIEVITREVMPKLPYDNAKIGIITPYNEQVAALSRQLDGKIDVATVHKFQGREKEAIVMSTVDDTIRAFVDDPNLLNVAVSRAKRKFCLVVSGNEQTESRHIPDLIAYIAYNNCTITESKICSVFDLLYGQYAKARQTFLKKHRRISEFDSENLTFTLLEKILAKDSEFCHLGIVCHQPLRQLIRDWSLLDEEERRYASNRATHLDFLIYNRVSKQPVLAIETDGYGFHKQGTRQSERDEKKNRILARYGLPMLRLSTIGTDEETKIRARLHEIQA